MRDLAPSHALALPHQFDETSMSSLEIAKGRRLTVPPFLPEGRMNPTGSKRSGGLHAGHTGNRCDQLIGQIALAAQTTALAHQFVDALVATQCRLNRILPLHVRAQAHKRMEESIFRPSM